MLIKHAARGDERIYTTYQNVEASSITTGYAAALALGTAGASFNGTQACLAGSGAAGRQTGWLGIASADIAPNAFGLIQQYGPVASVFISNVGTSITINVGDPLVPGAQAGSLFSGAPTYAASGFAFLVASNTAAAVSASAMISGFMRHGI